MDSPYPNSNPEPNPDPEPNLNPSPSPNPTQVSNAPDAWEEGEALRCMADVLRRPALSQYAWLLLPEGSAHVLRSWHRDVASRAPPTAAERHAASVTIQRHYRARAALQRGVVAIQRVYRARLQQRAARLSQRAATLRRSSSAGVAPHLLVSARFDGGERENFARAIHKALRAPKLTRTPRGLRTVRTDYAY